MCHYFFRLLHLYCKSIDYKFFCFDGVAESVMVCTERETGHPKFYFFDKEWNLKKYNIRGKEAPEGFTLPKPDCIDEMFAIAEKLSKGIPYVRVDLYCIDGLVYFGEMTFYPDSGFDANLLKESDAHWGENVDSSRKERVRLCWKQWDGYLLCQLHLQLYWHLLLEIQLLYWQQSVFWGVF